MELHREIFSSAGIYDMIFFNVTGILEVKTFKELNQDKQKLWLLISNGNDSDAFYQLNAINYPEFTKIISISYATVYHDGSFKRAFNKMTNNNEFLVLSTFFDFLSSLDPSKKNILCGDNIISYDIPLLIKRYLSHLSEFSDVKLPDVIKQYLGAKPWENLAIDTRSIWRFNALSSSTTTSLTQYLYTDLLSLKKTIDVLTPAELSAKYWSDVDSNNDSILDFISLQSATKVNLVIQLMNTLRNI